MGNTDAWLNVALWAVVLFVVLVCAGALVGRALKAADRWRGPRAPGPRFGPLLLLAGLAGLASAQAPALPEGLTEDPRLSWRPTLNPTATVVAEADGTVTLWRSGSPVKVPTNGRRALVVALEQLANDAGEWVGVLGQHQYGVGLGKKTDVDDAARSSGFAGVSIVGLDSDPTSSDWASIRGFSVAQYVGVQRDLALLNLTVDCWDNRPMLLASKANPGYGHFYLEAIRYLAIGHHFENTTPKGNNLTTWLFRAEAEVQLHVVNVVLEDGAEVGDKKGGTTEHGFYWNASPGDAEFLNVQLRGCYLSGIYSASRYFDRISLPGGQWAERYARGRLLVADCTFRDIGAGGTWAVNVTGGMQDVEVVNMHWRANLDGYLPAGSKWAGSAIQCYADRKVFELDPLVPNQQGNPVALGYSLEPGGGSLPSSPGIEALGLPTDGYGAARSLVIRGGLFEGAALKAPIINVRDVALVTVYQSAPDGGHQFQASGGTTFKFATSGPSSQNGKAGPGLVPAAAAGYHQQARFVSRKPPSTWAGVVKMTSGNVTLSGPELDSWAWDGK